MPCGAFWWLRGREGKAPGRGTAARNRAAVTLLQMGWAEAPAQETLATLRAISRVS